MADFEMGGSTGFDEEQEPTVKKRAATDGLKEELARLKRAVSLLILTSLCSWFLTCHIENEELLATTPAPAEASDPARTEGGIQKTRAAVPLSSRQY